MIYLIRHGESTSNAGARTDSHGGAPLSEKGWQQAQEFATRIDFKPDLIVVSPFLRTQQTSMPLRIKHQDTPVECWNVEEFSFLDSDLCHNTTQNERREMVETYFNRADPDYIDGKDAESFNQMLGRADAMLENLKKLDKKQNTLVFTHGNFIRGTLIRLGQYPNDMRKFAEIPLFANTQMINISPMLNPMLLEKRYGRDM